MGETGAIGRQKPKDAAARSRRSGVNTEQSPGDPGQ